MNLGYSKLILRFSLPAFLRAGMQGRKIDESYFQWLGSLALYPSMPFYSLALKMFSF